MAPVLRARRPLFWLCGTLLPWRSGWKVRPWILAAAFVAGAVGALAGEFARNGDLISGGLVVAVALPLLLLLFQVGAAGWYGMGAGRPMLAVVDGEVRGRLRAFWADQRATARPDAPDWWDIRLPTDDLTGYRVEPDRPGSPILVLDLPPELAAALLAHPETRKLAQHWQARVGSPAAWQIGTIELRGLRRLRLRAFIRSLPESKRRPPMPPQPAESTEPTGGPVPATDVAAAAGTNRAALLAHSPAATAQVLLQTERGLWRRCAALCPRWLARDPRGAWPLYVMAWAIGVGITVIVFATDHFGAAGFQVGRLVVGIVPLLWMLFLFNARRWYRTGAGRPVLVLDGTGLYGRLRPVAPGDEQTSGGDDPDWWDLRLPVTDLVGVRLTRSWHTLGQTFLALDLPPDVSDELGLTPGLMSLALQKTSATGTPAAWPAAAMLPPTQRRQRLHELVATLEQAQTATQDDP